MYYTIALGFHFALLQNKREVPKEKKNKRKKKEEEEEIKRNRGCCIPVAQSQYLEWVYFGVNMN